MSLRTVAPLCGGDHVKTAVDVQMTSAVRTVSPAAVHNGPRLSALLGKLTADLPLAVLRRDRRRRRPRRRRTRSATSPTCAGRRRGPRRTETAAAAGALARRRRCSPASPRDPYGWWHALAHLLFPPLLTVLDRGVALEAHGQNTLLVLRRHPAGPDPLPRPRRGPGQRTRGCAPHGVEAPPLDGDLPSDDPDVLRTKLAAAVLGTVAAQLIAVLARAGADPARLWASTAAAIRSAATGRRATAAQRPAAGQGHHRDAAGRRPARRHLGPPTTTRWRGHDKQPGGTGGSPSPPPTPAPPWPCTPRSWLDGYRAALPEAADTVGRRLRGALVREGIGDTRAARRRPAARLRPGRVRQPPAPTTRPSCCRTGCRATPPGSPPSCATPSSTWPSPWPAGEHGAGRRDPDARRRSPANGSPSPGTTCTRAAAPGSAGTPPTCSPTTWRPGTPGSGSSPSATTLHLGDDVGAALRRGLPAAARRRRPATGCSRCTRGSATPCCPARYRDLLADGALRILDDELDAIPTAALRTLLLPPAADGSRRYVKVSLDIQVTSTRRSISVASTRNGPAVSALLHRLVADDPDADRLLLMAETAGAAVPAGSGRDLSAILRDGLDRPAATPASGRSPAGRCRSSPPATGRRRTPRPPGAATTRARRRPSWTRTPGCCCRRCCG